MIKNIYSLTENNIDVNGKLFFDVLTRMILKFHYQPFVDSSDLDGIFYIVCQDKNWDYFNTIALYTDINPSTLFGTIIVIPNYTFEQLDSIIKKAINMKAFL